MSVFLPLKLYVYGIPSLHEPPWDTWSSHNGVQALGHHWHLDPLPRKGQCEDTLARQWPTHSLKPAESLLVLLNPPWEAGVFHLWFPNCPGSGKSWAFCNSFVWLLLGAIYPFNSVCSNVFHITSDIFSFHISYNIVIIFSWAIPFWKQITIS